MGREKRIAESRAKEMLERSKVSSVPSQSAAKAQNNVSAPSADGGYTSSLRALLHIVLLFLIPAFLLVVVGKLVFKL